MATEKDNSENSLVDCVNSGIRKDSELETCLKGLKGSAEAQDSLAECLQSGDKHAAELANLKKDYNELEKKYNDLKHEFDAKVEAEKASERVVPRWLLKELKDMDMGSEEVEMLKDLLEE